MQKGHTWYVRLMVPKQYREQLGRTRYLVSLETRDKAEANRRKHAVLADLQRRLDSEVVALAGSPQSARGMLEQAEWERRRVQIGEASQDEVEASFEAAVEDFLDAEALKRGRDSETGHPLLTEEEVRVIRAAHATVAGRGGLLLERAAETYLTEVAPTVRKQTLREKQRGLQKLSKWLGPAREVESVTRRIAGQYVTHTIARDGRSPKTQRDEVGHLSAFFGWLERRGEVESNPFFRVSGSIRSSTLGGPPPRRPWDNEELLGLLKGIPKGDPLWPMVAIAMYSGMRRDEVANLRVSDVREASWSVRSGKNASAVRTVPIHPVLMPLIGQLSETSDDGFLIPGLLSGGADGKRSHLVGKRFGTMRERLGIEDRALNYHTLRHSFLQRCEEAQLPLATAKQLAGHKRTDLTFGRYSPGVTQGSLLKALEGVSYGALDEYVSAEGKAVTVTVRARRRSLKAVRKAA